MRHIVAASAFLLLAACGSDDPAGPNNNPNGTMSATIDGQSWTANAAVAAVLSDNILSVSGASAGGINIAFAITPVAQPRTVTLGDASGSNVFMTGPGGATWAVSIVGGSGSVTVSALSATSATGTFAYTAVAQGQSTPASRVVTNGAFNVRLQ